MLSALLAGPNFHSPPKNLPDLAQISNSVFKYSNNPSVRAPKLGHNFDRNNPVCYKACNDNIFNNSKWEGRITSLLGEYRFDIFVLLFLVFSIIFYDFGFFLGTIQLFV